MEKTLDTYYQHICNSSHLPTPNHAQRWSRAILKTLGVHLDRSTKQALAKALPKELAADLQGVFWLLHFRNTQASRSEFQYQAAMRSGNTDVDFALYPILAVFAGLKKLINSDLSGRIANTLAPEIRALWQQAGNEANA